MLLSVALAAASVGCATHISVVRPLAPKNEAEVNDLVADRSTTLTFEDDAQLVDTRGVRLVGSSVRFAERDRASRQWRPSWLPEAEAPLASVRRIEFREMGRGALHGLGIGAITGIAVGAVVGNRLGGICDKSCSGTFTPAGAAIGGAGFAVIGALVGAAVGAPTILDFTAAGLASDRPPEVPAPIEGANSLGIGR